MPDTFDMIVTKADESITEGQPVLILEGAIVKRSLWRRNKLVVTGTTFQEKLTPVHLRELLAPALIKLGIQSTDELVGTIQHMQKQFIPGSLEWPHNLPQWMPCP